jgi:hydrogenase/urease accessory protein HupE
MTVSAWLKARSVELGASLCTAGLLLAGLAAGVPFLRARIPETFLYGFCCVTAVLLRAAIDLAVGGGALAARTIWSAAPAASRLEPSRA